VSGGHGEGDGHVPVGSVAVIVGAGDRFLSGVSDYYTALLTSALAKRGPVEVLLLRRLCPRAVYPDRAASAERCAAAVDRIDGGRSRDGRVPRDRAGKSGAVREVA
jgi:hypothetical protein